MTEKVEPEKVEPIVEPTKTPTVEELLAENKRLKDQNFTVLGEKKKIQTDLTELTAQNKEKRDADLAQKEDYKTMLDDANTKIENLNQSITKKDENALSRSIAYEVQKLAGDAKDVSDIMEKINVDENNVDIEKGTLTDLKDQIDHIRKTKPYLFESKSTTMTTKLPGMGAVKTSSSKKPLKTRIAEQLL